MSDGASAETSVGDGRACAGCASAYDLYQRECLAHLHQGRRDTLITAWAAGEMPLSLRGVCVEEDLLNRILDAAPLGDDGRRQLRDLDCTNATFGYVAGFVEAMFGDHASFEGATFGDHARFVGATFGDHARFVGATFGDGASFEGATFGHGAGFVRATFGDGAWFEGATFGDGAWFEGATFGDHASFEGATFGHGAGFVRATFGDGAWFEGATFGYGAGFEEATFGYGAAFEGATFGYGAGFKGATFGDGAWFVGATFGDHASFGPLVVEGELRFDSSELRHGVIVVAASAVHAPALRVSGACQVRLGGRYRSRVDVDLTDADCSSPTIVAPLSDEDLRAMKLDAAGANAGVRLVSMRRADVAELTCTDVDFSICRFAGAHHLDSLRIDGTTRFERPPNFQLWPPSRWRWWSRRHVLAEEVGYRASERRANGEPRWPGWQLPDDSLDASAEAVTPARLAGLYRALRKSREDAKDEPGAADFYYGEMEMRRNDTERPRAERWIIAAYWALSGYGLRASRALTALAIILAAATLVLWNTGFVEPTQVVDVALYAIGTAAPIGSVDPPHMLTSAGQAAWLILRFAGPLLVGFALLALRGRVKR